MSRYTMHARWTQQRDIARNMRHAPTPAEAVLWQHLRNRRLDGAKFRRQHPVDRFIVDFYCAEVGLAVEVDGDIHAVRRKEDELRQQYLEDRGIHFLRFDNDDVLHSTPRVLAEISQLLTQLRAKAPPLHDVERGLGGEVH